MGACPPRSISNDAVPLDVPICAIMRVEVECRHGGVTEVLTEDFSGGNRSGRVLLEREGELGGLEALITDALEGRGRIALIEGPPGIGKTALIDVARQRAGALGMSVLTARGGELEGDFGFGVVRQLLESSLARAGVRRRKELFAGAAAHARPVFEAAPGTDGDPTHAVLHGLYWLIANLCERATLLLAIDDVHWADPPSLRFLVHLARRLDGLSAAMILALRTGERGVHPELLESLRGEARPPILSPRPLSHGAVGSMVSAGLGVGVDPALSEACHAATGGNPFLLAELVQGLRGDARRPAEISPAVVRELASGRVAALLLRVGRLDPQAPALARAVAVLGGAASLSRSAALAGLETAQAAGLVRLLCDASLLAYDGSLGFVHPLVRTSVYEDIPRPERASLHRRAAELLAGENADPEVVALQLLLSEPAGDPGVVTTLRAAAQAALARGGPEVASSYLRRALAEPPAPRDHPGVLLELGSALVRAGEPDGVAHMREAFLRASSPTARAVSGFELGKALIFGARAVDESVYVLESALGGAQTKEQADRIEALLLLSGVTSASARARLTRRRLDARSRVEGFAEPSPLLLAAVSVDLAVSDGTACEAAEYAERALAGGALIRELVESDLPLVFPAVWVLVHTGRVGTALRSLDGVAAACRARGSPLGLATVLAFEAVAHRRTGDLVSAEAAARTSLELTIDAIGNPIATATLVAVLVDQGEIEEAGMLLGRLGDTFDQELMPSQTLRESRARLEAEKGDPRGALAELSEVARWEETWTDCNGIVPVPWRSAAALAHVALGHPDLARELAEEELARARLFGAARPIGVALSVLGSVLTGAEGIDLLGEAVSVLEEAEDRLEHARALFRLGAALRRAGHRADACGPLGRAMDLAHRCRASALTGRAHDELVLAGARPRRMALTGVNALTSSERRIAGMAAEGMSNKDIAQVLFITLRTVEMHLTSSYRKLGISSRRSLLQVLSEDGELPRRSAVEPRSI